MLDCLICTPFACDIPEHHFENLNAHRVRCGWMDCEAAGDCYCDDR